MKMLLSFAVAVMMVYVSVPAVNADVGPVLPTSSDSHVTPATLPGTPDRGVLLPTVFRENYSEKLGIEYQYWNSTDSYQEFLKQLEAYRDPELYPLPIVFLDKSRPEDRILNLSNASSLPVWPIQAIDPGAFPGFNLSESGVYENGSDCIRIVQSRLYDQRTNEEDSDWGVYLLVENIGEHPVLMDYHFLNPAPQSQPLPEYEYLERGERRWIIIRGVSSLGTTPLEIDYCRIEAVEISPEFINGLRVESLTRRSMSSYEPPFIYVKNATIVVKNAEKNWKSVILEFQRTGNNSKWDPVEDGTYSDVYFTIGYYTYKFVLSEAGNNTMEVPLNFVEPENITTVGLVINSGL